jgi:DNA-binding response OmpR family regulator
MQLNLIPAPRLLSPTTPAILKRVLVVDDDAIILSFYSLTLARAGYKIDTAADGEQGWGALCATDYDLLLTDNDMPGLTGVELVARLRRAGMTLPVIIASGSTGLPEDDDGKRLGLSAVLHKPLTSDELVGAVRQVLPHQRAGPVFTQQLGAPAAESMSPNQQRFGGLKKRLTFLRTENSPSTTLTFMNALLESHRIGSDRRESLPLPSRSRTTAFKGILVADDDAMVRAALAALLESEGYAVDEARNGTETVTRAIERSPDLVLLDLNMPKLDGWRAFVRLDHVTPLVPVIVITARPHQYKEAVRLGVDAFMEKPLNIPVLLRAIKRLVSETPEQHVSRVTSRAFVTRLLSSTSQ